MIIAEHDLLIGYVMGAVAGYYFRRMCECWKMEREYRRKHSANATAQGREAYPAAAGSAEGRP